MCKHTHTHRLRLFEFPAVCIVSSCLTRELGFVLQAPFISFLTFLCWFFYFLQTSNYCKATLLLLQRLNISPNKRYKKKPHHDSENGTVCASPLFTKTSPRRPRRCETQKHCWESLGVNATDSCTCSITGLSFRHCSSLCELSAGDY